MERDFRLFQDCEKGAIAPTLVIYSWLPKCISVGYSQKIETEIDTTNAASQGWEMVKRPTGGGIVFHNEAELTYSLVTPIAIPLLPPGLVPSYKKISETVIFALSLLGVSAEIRAQNLPAGRQGTEHRRQNTGLCFSYPAEYEIVVNGKKIVGSAQKRGRRALLQQGSIFVRNSGPAALALLKKPFPEYNAVSVEEVLGREVDFSPLSEALMAGFENVLGVEFI
jgi:lipoate-protein ligase A